MSGKLSVVICTYNPDEAIFSRCLLSVAKANSQYPVNEIIIVDNNSATPLQDQEYIRSFLALYTNARIVSEEMQGLTPARMKGIREATGGLVVFVDDDNFLQADFFEKGIEIADKNPHIGSWSGQVKLLFEVQPEDWTKRYWGLLVHREFDGSRWSNLPHLPETMPCGAGLFVRKEVASYYLQLHSEGKRSTQLDRAGSSLLSGGDNDLAACACDVGLGVGLFSELVLDHFIPKSRTTKQYLLKLAEGISASAVIFRSFRSDVPVRATLKNKIANSIRLILKRNPDRQFFKAVLKGEKRGKKLLLQNVDNELH